MDGKALEEATAISAMQVWKSELIAWAFYLEMSLVELIVL